MLHSRSDGRGAYGAAFRRRDADEVLALSAEQKSTSMFMAPTMVRRLLDRARATGQRGTGIRTIIYGGRRCMSATLSRRSIALGRVLSKSASGALWPSPH